jgi:hypothetical protein
VGIDNNALSASGINGTANMKSGSKGGKVELPRRHNYKQKPSSHRQNQLRMVVLAKFSLELDIYSDLLQKQGREFMLPNKQQCRQHY